MPGFDESGARNARQPIRARTWHNFPARDLVGVGHVRGVREQKSALFSADSDVVALDTDVDGRTVFCHEHDRFDQTGAGDVAGEGLVETVVTHMTTFPLDRRGVLFVDDERTIGDECHGGLTGVVAMVRWCGGR